MLVAPARSGNSQSEDRNSTAIECVRVSVPARLHVGFVDLHGGLGRRFGSLGISLDAPETRVRLRRADALSVEGSGVVRARAISGDARRALRPRSRHAAGDRVGDSRARGSRLRHAALACDRRRVLPSARARRDARGLAGLLDRGLRSSIGIASFERGGVHPRRRPWRGRSCATGHRATPFPDAWRVLLVYDDARPASRRGRGRGLPAACLRSRRSAPRSSAGSY